MRELEVEKTEQLKLDELRQKLAKQIKNGNKGLTNEFVNTTGEDIITNLENGIESDEKGNKGMFVDPKKPCEDTFDNCFKQNRDMNIQLYGMDFDKWQNFLWAGSRSDSPDGVITEYHPYQQDDLDGKTHTSAATVGNSQPYKGQWKTLSQVSNSIDENSYDEKTSNVITTLVSDTIERSKSIMPGENGNFNYDQEFRSYQNIVNKGNINSLNTQR